MNFFWDGEWDICPMVIIYGGSRYPAAYYYNYAGYNDLNDLFGSTAYLFYIGGCHPYGNPEL